MIFDLPNADDPVKLYQADVLDFFVGIPDDSIDVLCCSPPYERARLYLENGENLGIARDTEKWTAWMVQVVKAAAPKVRGVMAIVVEGQTRQFRYTASPFLLAADLSRAGFNLRKPVVFKRVGIPGSGGPDWFRNDWEPVLVITRPGKLPWSDAAVCGKPPKWAPGGAMSYRNQEGVRKNNQDGPKARDRRAQGSFRRITSGHVNGDTPNGDTYDPPVLANPGNVVTKETYTAAEVDELIGGASDVFDLIVGGGVMGHPSAHLNEAPFPLELCERFVRSFCPPDGLVCDPFMGSGTTGHAARKYGRRFIGCDLRDSQVEIARQRIMSVQGELFC